MKLILVFAIVPLVLATRPYRRRTVTIGPKLFEETEIIYRSCNDIVNIVVPINLYHLNSTDSNDKRTDSLFFFIEAENDHGYFDYKGLYAYKHDTDKTFLLENARDITTSYSGDDAVYIGATDGIYTYNDAENRVERYGTIRDHIISIVKKEGYKSLYIVTIDKTVYKVTKGGCKKTRMRPVNRAEQIMLDRDNNLYYYGADKQVYVAGSHGVKKIDGLPENPGYVRLIRPPIILDTGVGLIVDDKVYAIHANGTSVENMDYYFEVTPSAVSVEGAIIQLYGYKKKIYKYNILQTIFS